jgi:hypothetical protein
MINAVRSSGNVSEMNNKNINIIMPKTTAISIVIM